MQALLYLFVGDIIHNICYYFNENDVSKLVSYSIYANFFNLFNVDGKCGWHGVCLHHFYPYVKAEFIINCVEFLFL